MKIFILIVILANFSFLNSQINKSITGASPGFVDTLSIERSQKISDENKGLVDKPVNPKEYIVGPGDEFKVSIIQYEAKEISITVSPDNKLYIPKIGIVEIKDNTLEEVYSLIKKEIQKVYTTQEIFIALHKVRQFKVRLSGNVPKSMTIPAYATDRVSEIIDKAGALNANSSTRKIKIIRADSKEIINVDLTKYFTTSDDKLNPYVQGGDNIIVPEVSQDVEIHISGEIPIKDADFEYVEGDSLSTLIRFAQGFLITSYLDSVEISRFNSRTNKFEIIYLDLNSWRGNIYNFDIELENDFALQPGDRVYVRKNPNWVNNRYIKVDGQVKYPGKYPILTDETRVADILKNAGGFTDEAAPELAEYIRQKEADLPDQELERLKKLNTGDMSESEIRYFQARIREKKGSMAVDLLNAINDETSIDNIIVDNRDSIYIPRKKNYITVQGRVNNPGAIIYNKNFTYLDYINLAGGFGYRADEDETFITKPGGEQFLASDMNYIIEPGDVILIPPKKEYDVWQRIFEFVSVLTQVIALLSLILTISRL